MNKIKYTLISLLLLHLACSNADTPVPNYCDMLERDQSYVTYDRSDPDYERDKMVRHQIFKDNFEKLMGYVDKMGFPAINLNESNFDACMYNAITMTFIHIAQSQIDLFFKEKDVFQKEIKNNRLQKDLLAKSILVMLNTKELCEKTKIQLKVFIADPGLEDEVYQGEGLSEKLESAKVFECTGFYKN